MKHEVTQADMTRILNCIHDMWPDIRPATFLWDEMESAAMLGLTEASRDYHKRYHVTWEWYSLHIAIFRVKDVLRLEINRPCGIVKTGRDREPIEIVLSSPNEDDEAPCYLDPGNMIEHSETPDPMDMMSKKEWAECMKRAIDLLDEIRHSPHIKTVWHMWLSGYSTTDIAKTINMTVDNVYRMLKAQLPFVMQYMVRNYYSKYPYAE